MKKYILSITVLALLAAGCGSQTVTQTQNTPVAQNTPTPALASPTPTGMANSVAISKLSPASGSVNTLVTVTGSGFTKSGNTVNFGPDATISNVSSANGSTLQFKVPYTNDPPKCAPNTMCPDALRVLSGAYKVSVTNSNGASNSVTFTVNQSQVVPPVIGSLSPSSGTIGTSITITGSGFTPTGNEIKFGNLGSEYNPSYSLNSTDGKTITFKVPSTDYYACQNSTPRCYPPNVITQPGSYAVSVINADGTSNSQTFTVTR